MDAETVTRIAIIIIVAMGALLVGTEVANNLRLERELDEKRKHDEAEQGRALDVDEDPDAA